MCNLWWCDLNLLCEESLQIEKSLVELEDNNEELVEPVELVENYNLTIGTDFSIYKN